MPDGTLIAIGGHEDRDGERLILRAVADAMSSGPLLILARASRQPFRYVQRYREAFGGIGVPEVRELAVRDREGADDATLRGQVAAAGGVFFTGGSQARLVRAILGTGVHHELRRLLERGGVIAGTSAGASALGEVTLAGTRELRLGEGLGLLPGLMIDQHFAQRDRLPRLRSALGRRPGIDGIGIDEDTALVIRGGEARVIGSGEVWMLDPEHPVRRLGAGSAFTLGDTIAA
ncbi:MAG TPA: cyanophycinase [Pseudolysinimonas sp.]|jgi:cyanophycinase|nr:cyanophycinase [Pseudolysinimonas sp.]